MGVRIVDPGVVVVLGVVVVVEARTTIVPCMNGWMMQTYVYVPGVANVCDPLAPFASRPVLKLPLLAVALCSLGPLLVQITVSPAWIVSVPGVNL